MRYADVEQLIEAARHATITIREDDLAVLGGPSAESHEGSNGNTSYYHTDDGRGWIMVKQADGSSLAFPSDVRKDEAFTLRVLPA